MYSLFRTFLFFLPDAFDQAVDRFVPVFIFMYKDL